MRRIVISAIAVTNATGAIAEWKEQASTDRLTGKKVIRVETASSIPTHIFQRAISPALVLQCIAPPDGSAPYVGAFITFGKSVGISDLRIRYRFDDGAVINELAGTSRRGDYFQMPGYGPEEAFVHQIRKSSRLRVDFPLQAGNALMDFNLTGADAALKKVRCR